MKVRMQRTLTADICTSNRTRRSRDNQALHSNVCTNMRCAAFGSTEKVNYRYPQSTWNSFTERSFHHTEGELKPPVLLTYWQRFGLQPALLLRRDDRPPYAKWLLTVCTENNLVTGAWNHWPKKCFSCRSLTRTSAWQSRNAIAGSRGFSTKQKIGIHGHVHANCCDLLVYRIHNFVLRNLYSNCQEVILQARRLYFVIQMLRRRFSC